MHFNLGAEGEGQTTLLLCYDNSGKNTQASRADHRFDGP